MTGHYCDIGNADVLLTIGSNNVENHPASQKWTQRAKDKGATWICVDPRFTRTAALADIYCPIRSGTDLAFFGGLYNYIIQNDLYQEEYVKNYTNAAYLIDENFDFDPETGLFSGWDEKKKAYTTSTWGYQVEDSTEWDTETTYSWVKNPGTPQFNTPTLTHPRKDPTLQDPNCAWQVFKKHYERYDLDTVCSVCGMDRDTLEKVYSVYATTGARNKAGTILYALGQTQHHYGAQNTRAITLVQILLGNVGIAGGGVQALRGEPNVQGATDMAMLVADFPGYLKWPTVADHSSLGAYLAKETLPDGYYTNKPKFFVSALKEWFGENANVENDYGYDWLPKLGSKDNFSQMQTFEHMDKETVKGYMLWGMNPANSTANTKFARSAMAKLDWMCCVDLVETESAAFWKAPDLDPSEIQTEVYFLPAALVYEKAGTINNSGRWMQWRHKALDPEGDAKPDYEICDMLWSEIVDLYKKEGGATPEPILNTKWDYYIDGKIDPRAVAWAMNGYDVASGNLLKNFASLQADGSTACAIWIYGGFYNNNEDKLNPAIQPVASRGKEDPSGLKLFSKWAFSWPLNRRVIYNRASADIQGKPFDPERVLVEWDGEKWIQNDVADFVASTTAADGTVSPVPPNNNAFFMTWEQQARLVASTMKDMPVPEHYEPFESPTDNIINGSQNSPCIQFADNESVQRGDRKTYPLAATTYSVVEHWQTGAQTRACPVLVEAQPAQFVEISEELAKERGIANGDKVRVFNNRGSVELNALVTVRIKPFFVNGETVHLVGMVHHWGWGGLYSTGDTVNDLTPNVGDPNTWVPEYKAFLVDIEKI